MNEAYGYRNEDLYFIYDSNKIDRNSQIKLREFFGIYLDQNPKIRVFELRSLKPDNI